MISARSRHFNRSISKSFLGSGGIASYASIVPFIDFADPETGPGGRFTYDLPFPGNTPGDDDFFAMRNTGYLQIVIPGIYTFGTSSDDETRLRIDFGSGHTDVIADGVEHAESEFFGTANFVSAGNHAFQFTYFEKARQATTGLFAAIGDLDGSSDAFRLVGDTANDGISATGPEPSALMLLFGIGFVGGFSRIRSNRCKS